MAESLHISPGLSREATYAELLPQIRAVIAGEPDLIANLGNIAAMLHEAFGFLWTGFYRRLGDELVLGPFQGPLACTRIAWGKGVCGTAAAEKRTIVVPNVHEFPGHIACSALSNAEIVVPVLDAAGEVQLVLDIDSQQLDAFSQVDAQALEALMQDITAQHFS